MAYSSDFRAAALAAVDARRGSVPQVAAMFGITPQGLNQWLRQRTAAAAGTLPPKRKRGPKPKLDAAAEQRLRELHAAKPDGTVAHFHRELAAPVRPWAVWKALRRLGFTFKKRPCAPTSAGAPTSPRGVPPGRRRSRAGSKPAGG
jgi:transposase